MSGLELGRQWRSGPVGTAGCFGRLHRNQERKHKDKKYFERLRDNLASSPEHSGPWEKYPGRIRLGYSEQSCPTLSDCSHMRAKQSIPPADLAHGS